jgi:four helix bundle protein
MDIDDLRVYQMAMQLAEKVWGVVIKWDSFAKYSIGKQYSEAADSIGANISEGFGRFHFKDSKNFLYYSRGSLFETRTWTIKAHNRNLISDEEYNELIANILDLGIKLNNYINTIGKTTPKPLNDNNKKYFTTTNDHQ